MDVPLPPIHPLGRVLEAVRAVAIQLTREPDLSALLGLITRQAREAVGASTGVIWLWEDARQELVPFAWDGVGEGAPPPALRLGEGVAGTTAQRREGRTGSDLRQAPDASSLAPGRPESMAVLAEPLLYREQLVGVLALARAADGAAFTPGEQEVLRLFAAQAAVAVQSARLYRSAQTEVAGRQRTEAALRESEGRLRTIWDSVALGIVIIEPDAHTIVDANPAAAALIGAPRDQLVGKVCHQYICPAAVGRCPISDLGQPVDSSERTLLCVDGASRHIVKSAVPVLLDGRVHLLESFVDITARRASEEALERRTQQLEAVRAVAEEIARELDVTRLLRLLIARAAELVGAASATVYLWEPQEGVMVPAAWHGLGDWQAAIRHRLGEGMAGTVAETRQGVLVNDYRTSRHANPESLQHSAVTASLGEPLLYREECIGAITLNHEGGRAFTAQDQHLLRLFAAQAAIAIQNARLYEAARRELAERLRAEERLRQELRVTAALAALYGPLISPQTPLESIARLVLDQARRLTGSTHGYVATLDPPTGGLLPHTFTDMRGGQCRVAEALRGTAFPRGADGKYPALWGHALNSRKASYANAPHEHPAAQGAPTGHIPLERFLAAPVLLGDELVGQIALANAPVDYTEAHLAAIERLAEIFALAIQRTRAEAALRARTAQLEAVGATTADITRELDLAKLLTLFIQRAVALLRSVSGVVYLLDPEAGLVAPKAWVGHGDWLRAVRLRPGEGLAGAVIQGGQGIIENAYRVSPYAHPLFLARTSHTAVLGEPLRYHNRIIGAVLVDRRDEVFTEQDRDLIRLLADQAAIAIENARLYTSAQQALADLQRAQDELIRTEKLRGLGQMAAGIAHDLNNTLATILGQAELLRLRTHRPEVDEGLQTLQTAASDGAQVVRRLQDFARQRGAGPLSPCDLAQLVPEALELTRPRWQEEPRRKGILIEASVGLDGLPVVQGNPAEIREVLTNLIFNAVDAMPGGGQLRFTGRVCDGLEAEGQAGPPGVSPAHEDGPAAPPPAWVELAVSDTGIGMTEEVRRRVFDPFFTTKPLHGTGLGLSVVYGIVERHGGQIDVVSAPGRGTTVRIRFRAAAPAAVGPAVRPAPGAAPSCRILLVDDDAAVRETLATLLRTHGQAVIEAEGGEAGLRCLDTTRVDVVITDLGMPGVTGWEVARGAKARQADLPVVLLTGWGDQAGTEAPPDAGVDRLLAKPVPLATLLATIAELVRAR